MNRDFEGPKKYKKNEIEKYLKHYFLTDSCVDLYHEY